VDAGTAAELDQELEGISPGGTVIDQDPKQSLVRTGGKR